MLKLAVAGAQGRMGRHLVEIIEDHSDLDLSAALTRDDTALPTCDVLIDFTTPASMRFWLERCVDAEVAFVSGTTGLSGDDMRLLDAAATKIALLHATNTSLGIAVLNRLVADATRLLGPGFDVEIVETHHRHKVDAPSGTALTLADTVLAARGKDRAALRVGAHEDAARIEGEVVVHSLRVGDVAGEHQVHLGGSGERLILSHQASGRATFAAGAVRAARWLAGRAPGCYQISDVLGL
jgi:4-hydroxy-tetrahydrodipicolinate reductase